LAQAENHAVAAAAKQEAKAGTSAGRDSPILDPDVMLKICRVGLEMAEEVKGAQTKLSNRLNPNNCYFDAELVERYRRMSKMEKEMLWALDRRTRPSLDLPTCASDASRAHLPSRILRAGGGRYSLDLPVRGSRLSMDASPCSPPGSPRAGGASASASQPTSQSPYAALAALWPSSGQLETLPPSQPPGPPPTAGPLLLGPIGTRPPPAASPLGEQQQALYESFVMTGTLPRQAERQRRP